MSETRKAEMEMAVRNDAMEVKGQMRTALADYWERSQTSPDPEKLGVVERLPDDFLADVLGEINARDYEQNIYEARRITDGKWPINKLTRPIEKVVTKEGRKKLSQRIKGSLFEKIVGTEMVETHGKETELGKEVRQFMHRPERYGENPLARITVPDFLYFDGEGLRAVVEAKSGGRLLASRKQLRRQSRDLEEVFGVLKALPRERLMAMGMKETATCLPLLKFSENTEKKIVVPRGADVFHALEEPQLSNLKGMLEEEGYQIVFSKISEEELEVMAEVITKEAERRWGQRED